MRMRVVPFAAVLVLAACGGASPEAEAQGPSKAKPAAVVSAGPTPPPSTDADAPQFIFPVDCELGRDCEIQRYMDRDPGPSVLDYRCGPATNDGHEGIDIRLPDMAAQAGGVAVLAAAPGTVFRVRDGVEDISARIVGKDAVNDIGCGNAVVIDHIGGYRSSYCHMARGSVQVKPGDVVTAGQAIGRIGLSGLTEFPHLHFSVHHSGALVDPFAPAPVAAGACPTQPSMWTADAARRLAYREATILNAGFAGETLDMDKVEQASFAPAGPDAGALIVYMRAIMVRQGDALRLTLTGPNGESLAQTTTAPMATSRAHQLQFIGKKRPATGWPSGIYQARVEVVRGDKVLAEKRVETRL